MRRTVIEEMAVQVQSVAKVIKTLNEAVRPEEKCKILTSLCRTFKEDTGLIGSYKDNDFSELCGALINLCINEENQIHIEACRTLDILLSETRNRNFDFFLSILQINHKKRLKILLSLSAMEDTAVAAVAQKESILQFFKDCMQSIQPTTMKWLSMENVDNNEILKKAETASLTEDEDIEDNIVQETLKLFNRLYTIQSFRNNIQLFDTFLMDKVVTLAYMGHRKQRSLPLNILKLATAANLAIRLRTDYRELWSNYKTMLQNMYCKRMSVLVVACEPDWAIQWTMSTHFVGTDLHRGSGLVNSLLRVEEVAFKSADSDIRRQAFLSWKVLIDNFSLDPLELATQRRIKLLCVPLNAKNSKTEMMAVTKLEVWWHLVVKLYPDIPKFVNFVISPFLNFCFGPLGEKPALGTQSEKNVQPGKKFVATQVIAIDALCQLLITKEEPLSILPQNLTERVPFAIQSPVFQEGYTNFINSISEVIIILAQISDKELKHRYRIGEVLWNSIMDRIKGYESKIKVTMYKEAVQMVTKLCKYTASNVYIRDLLFDVILKSFARIAECLHFSDDTLKNLIVELLTTNNFSWMKKDHCEAIEVLLMKIVKPNNIILNHPSTLHLLWAILEKLKETKVTQNNMPIIAEMWYILATIAAKYMENSNKIVESTSVDQNFKTIESLIAFPFVNVFIEDEAQIQRMSLMWKTMYKHFDFQADLIVSIMPNEILNKTSSMMLSCLKKDKKCCIFCSHCLDGLLNSINYNTLLDDETIPSILQLLSHLTCCCIKEKLAPTELTLKAISAFMITVFGISAEKSSVFLKVIEPAMYCLIAHQPGSELDREISSTWETIINIFRGLHKYLTFDLVSLYRKVIIEGLNHGNASIASHTSTLVDLREGLDKSVQKLLDEISVEAMKSLKKKNAIDVKEKDSHHKKEKVKHVKPVGSFLNRKSMSPSTHNRFEKESQHKPKVPVPEPDSQDYVVIKSDVKFDVNCLTEHQKEMLKKKRDDIPSMYNDLSQSCSQDTQQLQQWFNAKADSKDQSNSKTAEMNGKEKPLVSTNVINITNESQRIDPAGKQEEVKLKPTISPDIIEVESPVKDVKDKLSESVAKKLDFESLEEFPNETEDSMEVSKEEPKEEEGKTEDSKRKLVSMGNKAVEKEDVRKRRKSLRKSNSNSDSKKDLKRKGSSDSESESGISVQKKMKMNSPDSHSGNGDNRSSHLGIDGLINEDNLTRRQKVEIQRLHIDMVFDRPLPSRRSAGKSSDGSDTKGQKSKFEEGSKKALKVTEKDHDKDKEKKRGRPPKKDSAEKDTNKKEKILENVEVKNENKKSIQEKQESIVKKGEEIREEETIATNEKIVPVEMQIEEVPSPEKSVENVTIADNSEESDIGKESTQESEDDIVESSQEPNSKIDKVMSEKKCFIKINKMESRSVTGVSTASPIDELDKIVENPNENIEVNETILTLPEVEPIKPEPRPLIIETKRAESLPSLKVASSSLNTSSPRNTITRFKTKTFPLQGRAAQMLGLVTKRNLTERIEIKDSDDSGTKAKKEKTIIFRDSKDIEKMGSPSAGSRQVKIFNNMKNAGSCPSPPMKLFGNLRNDGEKISPKLEKCLTAAVENDVPNDVPSETHCDDPKKKELPMLEWSNANPPSLTASPSASILKRVSTISSLDTDSEITPNKKKRVSFADPPVSKEMGYEVTSTGSPTRSLKLSSCRALQHRKDSPLRPKQLKFRMIHMEAENKTLIHNAQKVTDIALEREENKPDTVSNSQAETMEISNDAFNVTFPPSFLSEEVVTEITENKVVILEIKNDETAEIQVKDIMETEEKVIVETQEQEIVETQEQEIVETQKQEIVETQEQEIVEAQEKEIVKTQEKEIVESQEKEILVTRVKEIAETQDEDITETQDDLFDDVVNDNVKTFQDSVESNPAPNDTRELIDSISSNESQRMEKNNMEMLEDTMDVNNLSLGFYLTNSNEMFCKPVRSSTAEADTLPVTDSLMSQIPSQDTQAQCASQVIPSQPEELDDTVPLYPSLAACEEPIQAIVRDLTNPLWISHLSNYLTNHGLMSIGDLAKLTEREINRIPVKGNSKVLFVKNVLSKYERTQKYVLGTPDKSTQIVPSSTPLGASHTRREGERISAQRKNGSANYLEDMDIASLTSVSALEPSDDFAQPFLGLEASILSPRECQSKQNAPNDIKEEGSLEDVNLDLVLQRCSPEVLLAHFKRKVNEMSKEESRANLLNIVLSELPEMFGNDEHFFSKVFSTYHKHFQVSEYLDNSDVVEVKEAIAQKFSCAELADMLSTSLDDNEKKGITESTTYTPSLTAIWKKMPSESIVSYIKSIPKDKFMHIYKAANERLSTELSATELLDMSYGFLKAKLQKLDNELRS